MKTGQFNTSEATNPSGGQQMVTVPIIATLGGFTQLTSTSEGVDLGRLAALDRIYLRTDNSDYQIVLRDPGTRRATVSGGRLFAEPQDVIVRGSTCGGAMLRVGWIGIGLQLELVYLPDTSLVQNVTTSPVQELVIERAGD
jgi:hypothetical protein